MKHIACCFSSLLILVSSLASPAAPLPAPGTQERPAIAASSNSYLVVWSDSRGADKQIYGTRVSFKGEVLDPGGIPISSRRGWQDAPSVAFDGENYLVVWWQASESAVFGARVTPSGRVLDVDLAVDSDAGYLQWPELLRRLAGLESDPEFYCGCLRNSCR